MRETVKADRDGMLVVANGPRAWRMVRGLSQQAAAERAGITRQTLGRIERGESVTHRILERVAQAYETGTVATLLAGPGIDLETSVARARERIGAPLSPMLAREEMTMVPLFDGIPTSVDTDDPTYREEIPAQRRLFRRGNGAAFTIRDDSMYKRFQRGSVVVVDTDLTKPRNGHAVWVVIDGKAYIRTYTRMEDKPYVYPENTTFGPPTPLSSDARILGVVRAHWHDEPF